MLLVLCRWLQAARHAGGRVQWNAKAARQDQSLLAAAIHILSSEGHLLLSANIFFNNYLLKAICYNLQSYFLNIDEELSNV